MKKFFEEFKKFISRGNVMDMAVGVIIGAAFKSIVDSLVADIISPLLGLFGSHNLDAMKVVLIVLGVLVLLSALVLYACVVVGARYDRQSERWREEQEKRSDRSDR